MIRKCGRRAKEDEAKSTVPIDEPEQLNHSQPEPDTAVESVASIQLASGTEEEPQLKPSP